MSKWIQKEVDKQLENIEDNKEENHKKIVEMYFEKTVQKKSIKLWKILVPAATAFLITFFSVSILLNNIYKSPSEYFADNEVVVEATIEEIQRYSTSFELAFEKVTINDNKRVYDSVTQDTLRFSLQLTNVNANIDMLYITNERYECENNNSLLDRKKIYQGIEIINFSNLPNNSFTSIFAVFPSHRGVVTLQVQRCLQGLDGRTRSSLAVL